MPERITVLSLQELCIRFVSSNIDIWCGESDDKHREEITVDDNPVSNLPYVVLNGICAYTTRRDNICTRHLNTIIHKYTNRLDLSNHSPSSISRHAIKLIGNVCVNLTSLDISNTRVGGDYLKDLMKSIPWIEYLNLKSTGTYDMVLWAVGNNCPNLRELDVRRNRVFDAGIEGLCTSKFAVPQYDGMSTSRGLCRSIQKLFVSGTFVRDNGAITAIRNLPYLRNFDYHNTLKLFEKMHEQNNSNQFKLENIRCTGKLSRYSDDLKNLTATNLTIDAAARLCPNVTNIELCVNIETDYEWLHKITIFDQLDELSINVANHFLTLNYSSIAPLLKVIGGGLKSLTLRKINEVNLWDIAMCCAKLSRLHFLYFNSYATVIPGDKNISKDLFGELREIVVKQEGYSRGIPSHQLEMLLINCIRVEVVEFVECQTLSDELLLNTFEWNSFSHLRTFSVIACRNISISSITSLLVNSHSLKEINCPRCSRIDDSNVEELRALIRKNNLDVSINRCE